jgi:TctA family transporter
MIRGLVSIFIGLLLALVGMDTVSGLSVYPGSNQLVGGLSFVTICMGLFGLSEILVGWKIFPRQINIQRRLLEITKRGMGTNSRIYHSRSFWDSLWDNPRNQFSLYGIYFPIQ